MDEAKTLEEKPELPKKTKEELAAEKRQKDEEARIAAEEEAREKARASIIERLETWAEKDLFRQSQRIRREVTDEVKTFAEPTKVRLASVMQQYDQLLSAARKTYETAKKTLDTEYTASQREILAQREQAVNSVHAASRERYAKMEEVLSQKEQELADRFEGFKNQLKFATLDELKELEAKQRREHDAARTSKSGSQTAAV